MIQSEALPRGNAIIVTMNYQQCEKTSGLITSDLSGVQRPVSHQYNGQSSEEEKIDLLAIQKILNLLNPSYTTNNLRLQCF